MDRHRTVDDWRASSRHNATWGSDRACSMPRRLDPVANMQLISSRSMRRTHRYRAMYNSFDQDIGVARESCAQTVCSSVVPPNAPPHRSLAEISRPAKFARITKRRVIVQRQEETRFSRTSGKSTILQSRNDRARELRAGVLFTVHQAASTRRTNGVIKEEKGRTRDDG